MFLPTEIIGTIVLPSLYWPLQGYRWPPTSKNGTRHWHLSLLTLLILFRPIVSGSPMGSPDQRASRSSQSVSRVQAMMLLGASSYRNATQHGQDKVEIIRLERTRCGVHLQRQSGLPVLLASRAVIWWATRN